MIFVLIAAILPQIGRPPTSPVRGALDLFDPTHPRSVVVQELAVVRLDQLLSLTHSQRKQLLETPASRQPLSIQRPAIAFSDEQLQKVLTADQFRMFESWRTAGPKNSARRTEEILSDARASAMLLADYIARETHASDAQARRLKVAARGAAQRFAKTYRNHYRLLGENEYQFTTLSLLRDGRPGPLIAEISFWKSAVKSTLDEKQQATLRKREADRLAWYGRVHVLAITEFFREGFSLTDDEVSKLRKQFAAQWKFKRAVYPYEDLDHPLLSITQADLTPAVADEKAKLIVSRITESKRRGQELAEKLEKQLKQLSDKSAGDE